MPETPAEVIAAAVCSGPRFGGGPAPCEVCRGRAERDVAALTAQGYVIVRAEDIHGVLGPKRGVRAYIEAGRRLLDSAEHPAQPSGTLQDAQSSGDGITGPLAHADGSTGLSALRERVETARQFATSWRDDAMQRADTRPLQPEHSVWAGIAHVCAGVLSALDGADLDDLGMTVTPITEEKPDA